MATSFSEIENIKENVQPLRKGRSVKTLVSVMKQPALEKQQKLEAFDLKCQSSVDLDPWLSYIKFVQEGFPSGGKDILKSVLERCTQKFVDDERYKNDIKYIRLWVQYADLISDSVSVFQFLESKNIGQTLALFYEAYALVLENASQYTEAKRVYERGLNMKAEPTGRLKRHFAEFQARVIKYLEKMKESPGIKAPRPREEHGEKKESLLGMKSTISKNGSSTSDFVIFEDTSAVTDKKKDGGLNWGKLVPEKERQKENRERPTTWKKGLEEEDEEEDTEAVISFKPKSKKAEFVVFDENSHHHHLEKTVKIDKLSKPPKQEMKSQSQTSRDKDGRRKGEIPAYDLNLIVDENGEECQFEEMRARGYPRGFLEEESHAMDMSDESDEMDMEYTCVANNVVIQQNPAHKRDKVLRDISGANVLIGKATEDLTTKLPFQIHIDNDDNDTPKERRPFDKNILRTPTCDTPSTGGISSIKQRLSFSSAVSPSPVTRPLLVRNTGYKHEMSATPTATINTKAALSDVMGMFSGNLFDDPTVTATMTGLGLGLSAMKQDIQSKSSGGFEVFSDSNSNENLFGSRKAQAFSSGEQLKLLKSFSPPVGSEDGYYKDKEPEYAIAKQVHESETCQIRTAMMLDSDYENTVAVLKSSNYAVKITHYDALWEFYINVQLKTRLSSSSQDLFLQVHRLNSLRNQTWYMLMDFSDEKNLEHVIEIYKSNGKTVPQALTVYYAIEILTILKTLHENGFLHCNVKPSNLLLRDGDENLQWSTWSPQKSGAWASKGLKILDFRHAIDMSLYTSGAKFNGRHPQSNMQCQNMREGKEWSYDQDLYTAAYTIYHMLTGRESDLLSGIDLRSLYPVWNRVFRNLLSADTASYSGAVAALANSISSLETFLTENSSLSRSLKGLLVKQNILMLESS